MKRDCPLVIIRWEDSAQPIPAWRHLSQLPETRAIECATVGWLLKDDDDIKVLCQSVGDLDNAHNAQASGIMTIPTRCVISIERLVEEAEPTSSADPEVVPGTAGTGPSVGLADPDLRAGSAPRPRGSELLPM
jgi:hypothetical protein